MTAAFLWAQLEQAGYITQTRLKAWHRYHQLLEPLASEGLLRRPIVPIECQHNGQLYYVLLSSGTDRKDVMDRLQQQGIEAASHYVPLHSSPVALRSGRTHDKLPVTESISKRLIRLPLWMGITVEQQVRIVGALRALLLSVSHGRDDGA